MADLSERTKLPLRWAIGILVGSAALVGAAAVARSDIGRHENEIQSLKASEREHDRRIQRAEDNYRHIREGIDEIKTELKERR